MDLAFWQDRLAKKKALAEQLDDAFLELASGVSEYSINTGQTVTRVTRQNIAEFRAVHANLLAEIAALEVRCNGGGMHYARGIGC